MPIFFESPLLFFIFGDWIFIKKIILHMGKGDQKSKKGKISSGYYGVSRKKKKTAAFVATATAENSAEKKAAAKK
jgi:ribosomal small subunit protein bTHX